MSVIEKSVLRINHLIKNREVRVFTDREFLKGIQENEGFRISDVDVVTTASQSPISGTAAMLCVPVAERGTFTRAKKIWLNGILCFPGPAPNERLGLVDTQIFADQRASNKESDYNGAGLLLDIIKRKEIQVECLSVEGDAYESSFTLDQLEFARMYLYNCFFRNPCSKNRTCSKGSHLETIRAGSKVLLNKATGIVVGCGTRSSAESRSLSLAADMFEMAPEYMTESEAADIRNTIAYAVPVLSENVLSDLADCLREKILMEPVCDLHGLEETAAEYLKQLIRSGEFLLISSDMCLDNW